MKELFTLILLLGGFVGTASATWYLKGSFNNWGENNPFPDGGGTITIELTQGTNYTFKLYNSSWYGNSGNMTWHNSQDWSFSTEVEQDCTITPDITGSYVFTLTLANGPSVSVTYPERVSRKIYFFNNLSWSQPFAYFLTGEYWNNEKGSGSSDQLHGVAMTQVATGSSIWEAEVSWSPNPANNSSYIAILDRQQDNFENFYQANAIYNNGFKNNSLIVPNTTSSGTWNQTTYYKEGIWLDYPYTRSVTSGKFGTLCLPFDADVEGADLFEISSLIKDGSNNLTGVNLTSVESAEAGKSYIFKATGGTLSASYKGTTYATTANSSNGMTGNLSSTPLPVTDGNYVLSNNTLRKVNGGTATISQYRAFITLDGFDSATRGANFIPFEENATGIEDLIKTESGQKSDVYNLQGQRVTDKQKGLLIVNGKKMLIK